MLSANHQERHVRRILLKPGQCVRSITMIAEDCGLSRKAVRYAIGVLKSDGFIQIDEPFGAQKGHRLTVCKWATYQSEKRRRGTDGSSQGNTQGATNKNGKNVKKFIKPTPQEVSEYARSIDFVLDGEHFCAHYEARGWKYGAGRPMKDWKSAVVTWKKNAPEHAKGKSVKRGTLVTPADLPYITGEAS